MEPYLKIENKGISLIFPISEGNQSLGRIFTPKLSVNIRMPYLCQEPRRVGVQIYRTKSAAHSVMLFDNEVYLPEIDSLDIENCKVALTESETVIFFPRK